MSNEGITTCENDNEIVKELIKYTKHEEDTVLKVVLEDKREALDVERISCKVLHTMIAKYVGRVDDEMNNARKKHKKTVKKINSKSNEIKLRSENEEKKNKMLKEYTEKMKNNHEKHLRKY